MNSENSKEKNDKTKNTQDLMFSATVALHREFWGVQEGGGLLRRDIQERERRRGPQTG